jgi:AcrR family transcriptional regulator
MPKVSQDYRDARRAQILDAARRCFLREGFHATSMQDLFTESGLSAGAVYRYFASKDDVIFAIAEQNLTEVMDVVRGAATRPGATVGEAVAEVLDLLRRKDEQQQVGSMAILVWAEVLRNPTLAGRFRQLLTDLRADLVRLIADQRLRRKKYPATPDAVAGAVLSIVTGYLVQLAILGPAEMAGVPAAVGVWLKEPERR